MTKVFLPCPKQLNIFLKSSVSESRSVRFNRKTGHIREILTFSWLNEVEVLEGFIRDFCLWELIYEIGVINKGGHRAEIA